MPGLDGKGPMGEGPKTGLGKGVCDENVAKDSVKNAPVNFWGRGRRFFCRLGRGMGMGRGRGFGRGRFFGKK